MIYLNKCDKIELGFKPKKEGIKMGMILFLAVIVVITVMLIGMYNRFVTLKNQCDESWSGIDVQLKRRYDLIPNVIETVKGYAKHEKETLENVITARNRAMSAATVEDRAEAEKTLAGSLKTVFALTESYPDLKANQGFVDLQKTLADIENNIQNARRYYNAVVRDFNTMCETFPSVLIANMFAFSKKQYFEINEAERENIKVQF